MSAPRRLVLNARMYAVTPGVEAAWRYLLGCVVEDAGVEGLTYLPWPAPAPLEDLWTREDLGLALMCGFPIALGLADVTPVAAPVPDLPWAGGRAVYRSDLVVAATSRFETLADTFGGSAGWTVAHSHSGFNAFRHHLLSYRTEERPQLYGRVEGGLVTARAILDAVADGRIDVGPLDAWWHALLADARPDLTARVRVVESTALAPMPAFVAGPAVPEADVTALTQAFSAASSRPWFGDVAQTLRLAGFAPVGREAFAPTLAMAEAARVAGYREPS